MSRWELWLTAAAVFVIALVVRVAAASTVPFPIPEDTAYYYGVARNLVEGRGLVSDAVWSFQTPPLVVPRPAFEVWMPLPTFLAAIPMALLGASFAVAQVVPILIGSLVPVLAWRLALDVARERGLTVSRSRVLAFGAGLTAAVELPLVLHGMLLDSTALFALFVLAACLLMSRLLARPPAGGWGAAWRDPRLLGLGALMGLAALTRNEAIWLAGTWVVLVAVATWRARGGSPDPDSFGDELRRRTNSGRSGPRSLLLPRIVVPAAVAIAIFAPWAIRNWLTLGSPLPGQAVTNAFSVTGFDIFAFQDPPTLSRYLAVGPGRLIEMRVEGFLHNLLSVLLIPSFPIGVIGLLALPWFGRGRALRPLLVVSLITFAFTTLVFPVATTWGTYLHAAGAAHVLLIVSCLFALDALIVRVGRFRGWTRPVAWLGPTLTIAAAVLFTAVLLPGFGGQSREVELRYQALRTQLAATGIDVATMGPVITDFPIWWAETERSPALALPDEPASSLLTLARAFPGTRYLVLGADVEEGRRYTPWTDACFREIALGTPADAAAQKALSDTRTFELVCP